MKITILKGDWEAIYKDGIKMYEASKIDRDILALVIGADLVEYREAPCWFGIDKAFPKELMEEAKQTEIAKLNYSDVPIENRLEVLAKNLVENGVDLSETRTTRYPDNISHI